MPTEPTVEDVVRQIVRAGWQASRTGNGELYPDDIARLAAELQSRLNSPTDQQLRAIIDEFPELNMRNYNDEDVSDLNQWGIRLAKAVYAPPAEAIPKGS